jgi:membrane fusion protein, multidrug efflux system
VRRSNYFLGSVALLALAGCSSAPDADTAESIRPVLSAVVTAATTDTTTFVGLVEPQVSAKQAFLVGGRIVTRPVHVGQQVKEGDVLARLDTALLTLALDTARANLATAQAQSDNAAASAGRAKSLAESDTTSQATVDQAREAAEAAKSTVDQASARVEQAEEQLDYADLQASLDGVVTSVNVEPGEVVGAGQQIATIARPDARDVVIDVPEQLAATIEVGDSVTVWPQLTPDTRVTGTIREKAAEADSVTRLWHVKIGLTDAPLSFWLGTTAVAAFDHEGPGAIVIPATAIRRDGEAASVFVIDAASQTVQQRPVKIATEANSYLAITEGLADGDRIAVAGVNQLHDGQQVRLEGSHP